MRYRPFRPVLLAVLLTIASFAGFLAFAEVFEPDQPVQPEQPKLVVLVIFDQMRGDYLMKWESLFVKDGFNRLLKDGAWYQNCHYPYAYVLTAPGHASIATGTTPSKHGIVGNDWYDRAIRGNVTSISANRYQTVPLAMENDKRNDGPAPVRLKQPTVGDSLQKSKTGKAKVVALSLKAHAIVFLAALRAQAVYWLSTSRGLFVTSSFYRDTLHPWVDEFNKQRPVDKYFGKDWNRLRPDLDYQKLSGPDDVASEGPGYKQGRTFPHPTTGGLQKPGGAYYSAFTHSPYGNEVLLELTKRAIDAEKLGQRDTSDLLCVSFSCNDLVGHTWGPDSQEVMDMTLRSDLIVKELLAHLDAKVGKDRYVVVVTADHGVSSIPEVAKAQGKDGGRVASSTFTSKAATMLHNKFTPKLNKQLPWIEKYTSDWIYLNHAALKEAGVKAEQAEQALVEWLPKQPGIHSAFARSRLEKGPLADDEIGERVRLSYHPDCSGDVAVVLKPYHMVSGAITGDKSPSFRTTHGMPHPYDTHVPLLVYGAGVKAGVRQERVTPLAAAAIMARGLGVPPPDGASYPVPEGLFK